MIDSAWAVATTYGDSSDKAVQFAYMSGNFHMYPNAYKPHTKGMPLCAMQSQQSNRLMETSSNQNDDSSDPNLSIQHISTNKSSLAAFSQYVEIWRIEKRLKETDRIEMDDAYERAILDN